MDHQERREMFARTVREGHARGLIVRSEGRYTISDSFIREFAELRGLIYEEDEQAYRECICGELWLESGNPIPELAEFVAEYVSGLKRPEHREVAQRLLFAANEPAECTLVSLETALGILAIELYTLCLEQRHAAAVSEEIRRAIAEEALKIDQGFEAGVRAGVPWMQPKEPDTGVENAHDRMIRRAKRMRNAFLAGAADGAPWLRRRWNDKD